MIDLLLVHQYSFIPGVRAKLAAAGAGDREEQGCSFFDYESWINLLRKANRK